MEKSIDTDTLQYAWSEEVQMSPMILADTAEQQAILGPRARAFFVYGLISPNTFLEKMHLAA